MINIEVTGGPQAGRGYGPRHDVFRHTAAGGADATLEFTCPDANTAIPLHVTRESSPSYPRGTAIETTQRASTSTITIVGAACTISAFSDGVGLYTYRIDVGAMWLMLELTVTA